MYIKLTTERLELRPLSTQDFQTVHSYSTDDDVARYMYWLPHTSEIETETFLENIETEWSKDEPTFYEFAVVLNGTHIGAVSLYINKERTDGIIGWLINKKYWNKGYAAEAARAVIDFAQKDIGIGRVCAMCDHRNKASQRVMEKIGMLPVNLDGIRRYVKTGEVAKEYTYELVF